MARLSEIDATEITFAKHGPFGAQPAEVVIAEIMAHELAINPMTHQTWRSRHDRLVFRLLFYSPRIAPNTGNAIRTVAATGCELHLVEPLGFDLSEPKLRRAGLDYHDLASVTVHASLAAAWDVLTPARVIAFTTGASTLFAEIAYHAGDVLMFGPEPTGLDPAILADPHITSQVRIPMLAGRRSLNLSNAAAVAVYEAWRQHDYAGARPKLP